MSTARSGSTMQTLREAPKPLSIGAKETRLRALESKLTDHTRAVLLVNEQEAELFRRVVPE